MNNSNNEFDIIVDDSYTPKYHVEVVMDADNKKILKEIITVEKVYKPDYEEVKRKLLFDENGNKIGYISNCCLEYNVGLSTQVPWGLHITTNMYDRLDEIEEYDYWKKVLKIYKPRIEVTDNNCYSLMILEVYCSIWNWYNGCIESNGFKRAIEILTKFAIKESENIFPYLFYTKEQYNLTDATNIEGDIYWDDHFFPDLCKEHSLYLDYKKLLKDVPEELHYNIKRLLDKLPSEYRDYRKCTIEHGPLGNTSIAILKYNITENLTGQLFTIELGIPRYGDKIRVDWYIAKHKVREIDIFIFKEMRISRFEKFTLFRFMESNKDYLIFTKDYLDKKRKGLLENE